MMTMPITIYHNPRCTKSRLSLALLNEKGFKPTIIEYLNHPPDHETLKSILTKLGISARELMRTNEQAYKDAKLDAPELTEDQLIDAMISQPVLIERPIVIHGNKAVIGRPPENILEII